jgi:hypothetical protein
MRRRRIARNALIAGLALVVAGCTSTVQPADRTTDTAEAPKSSIAETQLMGHGTVLQRRPAEPEFCLGYIATSDPPMCRGPVIDGWNWDSVAGSQTVGMVTHGDYLLQGTWDGKTFTLGQTPPRPLGLNEYVLHGPSDPRRDAAHRGAGTAGQLRNVRNELLNSGEPTMLSALVENGYVFLKVIYDDESIQKSMDRRYGANIVAVESALLPVP